MIRYAHTNLVARDVDRLISFYVEVFGCRHIGEYRDIRGEWLDRLVGMTQAHAVGEHLALPGFGDDGPTLEIFQYDSMPDASPALPYQPGFTHLAFEVDNVETILAKVLAHEGSAIGDLVQVDFRGRSLTVVYARDPEGNVIEIQRWDVISVDR